ncbi:MAG TPA: hypothetical protein VGN17_14490 [Bryobacteraceae bacterium]|jgi:regulator of replication initiation timing
MVDSRTYVLKVVLCFATMGLTWGQDAGVADALKGLTGQIQELRRTVDAMREELASSQREANDLRRDLTELRAQVGLEKAAPEKLETMQDVGEKLDTLREEQTLLNAKSEEQNQTKISSGSKYRVRLSGMVLFNAFHTRGAVDSMDVPKSAAATTPGEGNGGLGASLRQSMLSVDVFGPVWKGAQTRGDLTFDFAGGFPATSDGLSSGLARLRTANLALDGKNTSVVAGQDAPFFSPLSPSSLVSTAYPPLSSSGNLWAWTPQVYVEHRHALPHQAQLTLQAGVLDALTGELPAGEYDRLPTAGERTRTPAYAARASWQRSVDDRSLAFGTGGYYSRQNWGFQRKVDAWAATADWNVPFGPWLTLSGEFYRGRSIGGLGGGANASVVFHGASTLASSAVLPLESAGGWSQLKFKPQEKLEFNLAFGEDTPFRFSVNRALTDPVVADSLVSRNANGFLNVIYKARSNLLFSVEYRRLWTSHFSSPQHAADHVGIGAGIIF